MDSIHRFVKNEYDICRGGCGGWVCFINIYLYLQGDRQIVSIDLLEMNMVYAVEDVVDGHVLSIYIYIYKEIDRYNVWKHGFT